MTDRRLHLPNAKKTAIDFDHIHIQTQKLNQNNRIDKNTTTYNLKQQSTTTAAAAAARDG
jgi:hypothetical protein